MGAGRSATAGASWSVLLRTAPSSLRPAALHGWACSSFSCKSQGSLAVVVAGRAQPSTCCHVSAPCNPAGTGTQAPPCPPRGPWLAVLRSLLSPGFQQLARWEAPTGSSLRLLYPGLDASAPGASQSIDWDSMILGSREHSPSAFTMLLSLAIPSSPQPTCSLSLQSADGAGADGGRAWPLPGRLLLTLVAALASLLPVPQTEPLRSQAFLHPTPLSPRVPGPRLQPCAPSAPARRSPGEAAALKDLSVPPQPAGRGPRLPEVYCIISCIGCFGLFSKVGVERDSSVPAGPMQLPGLPGRLTRLCSPGP